MARIRSIKPEFWTHEKPTSVSRDARLLFIGIWNFADDSGRIHDSSRELKLKILPGDEDITSANVEAWLVELANARLIQRYEVNGKRYLQVLGWDHQKIQHPSDSKIPRPPEVSETLTSPHESSLLIGREGKGSSVAKATGADAPSAEDAPSDQDLVWGDGLRWLSTAAGRSPSTLRSLVGRWCKAYGAALVLTVLNEARGQSPPISGPIAWIEASLKTRSEGRVETSETKPERSAERVEAVLARLGGRPAQDLGRGA